MYFIQPATCILIAPFLVSNSSELNLLGHTAIKALDISLDNFLFSLQVNTISISGQPKPNLQWLQKKCKNLCQQYGDVFKQELGVLQDYKLEIEFKPDAKPVLKTKVDIVCHA